MKRRSLLKNSLLMGTIGVVGGTGAWLLNGYDTKKLNIDQAIEDLNQLKLSQLNNSDGWNLCQTFNHLSQSIEFSMTGYPVHKSDSFKTTIGQSAFVVFSIRGKMNHNLVEPIPGAPMLAANDTKTALNRLINTLNDFRVYQAELMPHFAYGGLSHQEYTWAHVMHINNHLEEFI